MFTCNTCFSTEFFLEQGFYYCSVCGTQSQIARELEHEDEGVFGSLAGITKIKTAESKKTTNSDGSNIEKSRGKKRKSDMPADSEDMDRIPAVQDDYMSELDLTGLRLATFTKLLSKYSTILMNSLEFPSSLRDHVLNILQRYLMRFEVAFCASELDETNAFQTTVENTNFNADIEARKRLTAAKVMEQTLNSSNILSELAGMSSDQSAAQEEGESVNLIVHLKTKLSCEAVRRLSILPMLPDICSAILYIACLCSGAKWILISDVARWLREGRFPLTLFHRIALAPGKLDNSSHPKTFLNPTCLPLTEYMRSVFFISQLTKIPLQPISTDFDLVLSRLCYNLNLPKCFLHRVFLLRHLYKPMCSINSSSTYRYGRFNLEKIITHGFMKDCIGDCIDGVMTWNMNPRFITRRMSLIPTPEIKAIALILFALKLMFGIDDASEYEISPNSSKAPQTELFSFAKWLKQLTFRVEAWRGRDLNSILSKRRSQFPSYENVEIALNRMTKRRKDENDSTFYTLYQYAGRNRDRGFQGCVPDRLIEEDSCYFNRSSFEGDIREDNFKSWEREALLAPLRYQSQRYKDWYDQYMKDQFASSLNHDFSDLDRSNVELFFTSFYNHSMDFEVLIPNDSEQNIVHTEARCKSDAERVEWRRLFPCSMRYTAYQRPRYLNGLCARFHRKKDIYDPMIYSRATRPLYYCAETSFSQNFKDLVQLLSLTIGERVEFVYTYFIMLETMCLAGEGEILDKAGAFEDIIIPAESNRSLFREYGPDQNSITIKLVDNKTSMANWKYHLVKISDRSVRVSRRNDDTSESDTSDASTPDSFSSNCEDSGTFDGENLFKKINASCSKFPDSRHKRQSFYHSLSSWALDFNIAFALTIPKFW